MNLAFMLALGGGLLLCFGVFRAMRGPQGRKQLTGHLPGSEGVSSFGSDGGSDTGGGCDSDGGGGGGGSCD